jgi:hypothetical protein
MNLGLQTEAALAISPIAEPQADSETPAFSSLKQSAALEFHATVQLLAERARFLTAAAGVAVALEQGGQFVYTAAAGTMVPEIGATADITKYPLRKCIKTGEAVRLPLEAADGRHPGLAVAILRDKKVVGFFELAPEAIAFEDDDVESISRLAAGISTALEHLEAAEHSAKLIGEAKSPKPTLPAGPLLWHAPETTSKPAAAQSSTTQISADVHPCTACGFPVSGARTLCVDCDSHRDSPKNDPKNDRKNDPKHDPTLASRPPAALFATEAEESWISAHGYTIASVLVSALAVAIIYWLR